MTPELVPIPAVLDHKPELALNRGTRSQSQMLSTGSSPAQRQASWAEHASMSPPRISMSAATC